MSHLRILHDLWGERDPSPNKGVVGHLCQRISRGFGAWTQMSSSQACPTSSLSGHDLPALLLALGAPNDQAADLPRLRIHPSLTHCHAVEDERLNVGKEAL